MRGKYPDRKNEYIGIKNIDDINCVGVYEPNLNTIFQNNILSS